MFRPSLAVISDVHQTRLGLEEVRAYQLYPIAQQRSWSHINQVVCALRFLAWTDAFERIVAAREPQKLPVVFSADEIVLIANRLGPAQPRAITWNGAGAWLIFSQSRQVNFSRTCWITGSPSTAAE